MPPLRLRFFVPAKWHCPPRTPPPHAHRSSPPASLAPPLATAVLPQDAGPNVPTTQPAKRFQPYAPIPVHPDPNICVPRSPHILSRVRWLASRCGEPPNWACLPSVLNPHQPWLRASPMGSDLGALLRNCWFLFFRTDQHPTSNPLTLLNASIRRIGHPAAVQGLPPGCSRTRYALTLTLLLTLTLP